MSAEEINIDKLLEDLSCKMSHCVGNKHYFNEKEKLPTCRECGADLVDWEQVRKRKIKDVEQTFNYLKYECVRHVYWCRDFDQHAVNYALRRGRVELYKRVEHRIRNYTAKPTHFFDKTGTSWEGNPIHYAQHATATCCRDCIEKWHGVPSYKPLTERQIVYFTKLIILYLEERFPDLPDEGQKVPPIPGGFKARKRKRRNDH